MTNIQFKTYTTNFHLYGLTEGGKRFIYMSLSESVWTNGKGTRMMFIKHYAPNRCLSIKVANSIDHRVDDCRDVTKAGGGRICTKNGSYCEKEKK